VIAEALVSVVDYTNRVLLTGLADGSPHYIAEKSRALAEAATRVADLVSHAQAGGHRLRWPVIRAQVSQWSQSYTSGRLLFPTAPRDVR
jgi:hypothetical protein